MRRLPLHSACMALCPRVCRCCGWCAIRTFWRCCAWWEKEWDEWVALQERLAERQKKSLSGATNQKVQTGEATAQHTAKQLQKKKVESSKVEQGQKMKEYVPATSQFLSRQIGRAHV